LEDGFNSLFSQADFTVSAVLHAICGEVPQLHGFRLAFAANSTREKSELDLSFRFHFGAWEPGKK